MDDLIFRLGPPAGTEPVAGKPTAKLWRYQSARTSDRRFGLLPVVSFSWRRVADTNCYYEIENRVVTGYWCQSENPERPR